MKIFEKLGKMVSHNGLESIFSSLSFVHDEQQAFSLQHLAFSQFLLSLCNHEDAFTLFS